MELSIRIITWPRPIIRARVVVLIIVIVAILAFWLAGYAPGTAVSLVLGAGLGAAQIARVLTGDITPAGLPAAVSSDEH
jgi:hypothetical protein